MKREGKAEAVGRNVAFQAVPRRLPVLSSGDGGKGELHLAVECDRPRWQRRLGAAGRCRRTFILDGLGRRCYGLCDGTRTVRDIVTQFAGEYRISVPEAEYSVTTYLKTLMAKGLVCMQVAKERT